MKKLIFLTFIAAFFFSLGTRDIFACSSCAPPKGVKEEYKTSTAIFAGKVISVTKLVASTRVKIKVEQTWKGNLPEIIEIRGAGMYGFNFTEGESYLVYANGKSEDALHASVCSRTKIFAEAAEDIEILNKLKNT